MEQEKKTFLIEKWFIKALIFIGLLLVYWLILRKIFNLFAENGIGIDLFTGGTGWKGFPFILGQISCTGGIEIPTCYSLLPLWAYIFDLLFLWGFGFLFSYLTYKWIYKKIHKRRDYQRRTKFTP